jgi:hypothetical protein
MSSYLLLRNNKESGPFTMDEIKGMSLKAYDLIWVVGKSAAWRYPGEVSELKSFAPAVPEQAADFLLKMPNTDNSAPDSANNKKPDSTSGQRSTVNGQRSNASRSVYVNLPAEIKSAIVPPTRVLHDTAFISSGIQESEYDFSDIYKKQLSRTIRYSGKILWISTVLLLFGAGILTGFFISDRRKFFTSDANHPQNNPVLKQVVLRGKKDNSSVNIDHNPGNKTSETGALNADSVKKLYPSSKKLTNGSGKKNLKNNAVNKDSIDTGPAILSSLKLNDSLKQNAISKTEALYQKIKAHPENYVNLVTGRYSTGLFGGISSFPVTVSNNSSVKMDLVVVSIDYVQNNEKVYKTENLSFNDLEAGETVTIKAPKSSRGIKITTHIHVVNTHQPDLSSSN